MMLAVISSFTLWENAQAQNKKDFIKITDCAERQVMVPAKVDRIACLYLFAGHVVTMLGRGDDIVAVSNGLKRDSLLLEICPSIKNAMVPKSQGALNMEELLKAVPDVLFIAGDTLPDNGEMEKLARFGIPTIIIDFSDIISQQRAISIIGKAIGREKRAEEYNSYYRNAVEKIRAVTTKLPEDKKTRLYYAENEALRTTLNNDLSRDSLNIAGVINVALNDTGNILEGKNFVTLERIILWNPEVILVNEPEAFKLIKEDRKWAAINAVINNRVYQMPIALSRWGHPGSIETPLAIMWTAKKIYPTLFPDIDMEKETMKYYKTFFNYDLSEAKVRAILNGELVRKPKRRN
jgi:iron complex transport system substrate-binding protein